MSDYNQIDKRELDAWITREPPEDEIVYCANDYCENEATYIVYHSRTNTTPLCETCKTAYEWGQASPEADLMPIEDYEEMRKGNKQ